MKNTKTIEVIELSRSECMDINAKGWIIIAIGAFIGYIASEWGDFKQGFADGFAAIEAQL